jgi:predicted ribosomally synthesized peptide with nif11-like leader
MDSVTLRPLKEMSEEQLKAFLEAVKDDAGLQQKLKGAADLDAAVAIAKKAGFDVSKADWPRYQAKQALDLSDEELEGVAGGKDEKCQGGNSNGKQTMWPRCGTSI